MKICTQQLIEFKSLISGVEKLLKSVMTFTNFGLKFYC
jgi:hypothetical protein